MDSLDKLNFKNIPDIYNELPSIKSEKIEKWLRKNIFNAGYIFYNKKKNEAICSVCGGKFDVPAEAKNNVKGNCPSCNAKIKYRCDSYSRKKIEDKIRLVLLQSKGKNLYVTINMIILDYTDGYGKLYKDCEAVYKFNRKKQEGHYTTYNYFCGGTWDEMKTIYVPRRQGEWMYAPLVLYDGNINTVFNKTDLKYCKLNEQASKWRVESFIKIIDINAKYQAIEKLYKAELHEIIKDKINEAAGGRAIKWNKTKLKDILSLTKPEITKIRELKYGIQEIYIYKKLIKENIKVSLEEIKSINFYDFKSVSKIKTDTFKNLWKYFNRQMKLNKNSKTNRYYSFSSIADDYKDYIAECKQLQLDFSSDMIRYPKDLKETHARTSMQVKIITNKEKDEAIYKIALENKNLNYIDNGLIITVAESATDIIKEGKELNHCVGGYIERVTSGESIILFVRKETDPAVPYYTLELKSRRINQCRGNHNCNMTDEVNAFIDKWHKEIVIKKKKSTKTNQKPKKEKIKAVA